MDNVTKITSPLLIAGKNSNKPLDYRYGPYPSIENAYNYLGPNNLDCIFEGLTIGIKGEDGIEEYWFKGGTDINHLVLKNDDIKLIWNK